MMCRHLYHHICYFKMHIPVMLHELVDGIYTDSDGIYIDCTGGGGSHSFELLKRLSPKARLIILDRDLDAIERLEDRFKEYQNVKVIHSSFSKVIELLDDEMLDRSVSGIFADFGTSSYQLRESGRGFSFRLSGDIDMRMDQSTTLTAGDIVNNFDEKDISSIIYKYGEEQFARNIAKHIVAYREKKPFENTLELAETVAISIPKKLHKHGIHPATKTFQALRIYTNNELEEIELLLESIGKILVTGGRFAAISFHSLEDRLVKQYLTKYSKSCICPPTFPLCTCNKVSEFKLITKKALTPTQMEIDTNPLSRSAKLRVAEKI